MKHNFLQKTAKVAILTVLVGALLVAGAGAAMRVACTHVLMSHDFDVVSDAYGNAVRAPCQHPLIDDWGNVRVAHPFNVIH